MIRLENWEEKLADFVGKHYDTATLEYGKFDCAIGLATGAIKAITGNDVAAKFRGKYKSAMAGQKLLKAEGFNSLAELASSILEEKPVAFAQRGDIMLYQGCLGVCIGRHALFMPDEMETPGLLRVEALSCEKAWKV